MREKMTHRILQSQLLNCQIIFFSIISIVVFSPMGFIFIHLYNSSDQQYSCDWFGYVVIVPLKNEPVSGALIVYRQGDYSQRLHVDE